LSTFVGSLGELGLQIALIVLYSSTLSIFNEINMDALKYYADNDCSDGPLQDTLDLLATDLSHDHSIVKLGLAFVVLCFVVRLSVVCCYSRPYIYTLLSCLMPRMFKQAP
jgi:hypothetical protein